MFVLLDLLKENKSKISILSITGTMALIALVANVMLAKLLPITIFGKLGFVIMIAPVLSVIALRGQEIRLLRIIAKYHNDIRWKPLVKETIFKSSGVAIIVFSIVFLISGYNFVELGIIIVIGIAQLITYLISSCLRAINREIEGLLLVRLIPASLIAIAGISYLFKKTSLLFVLGLLTIGYCMQCLSALIIFRNVKEGNRLIPSEVQTTGSAIISYNLATLLLLQSDRFVCKVLYGFDQYAIYHATKMLVRPIQLVSETMDYYTLPRLAIQPIQKKLKKYINESLLIAAILGVAYLLWGNSMFRIVYSGKFGTQRPLLLLLTLLEIIILVQIPLANCLQASGRNKQLWKIGIISLVFIVSIWCVYVITNGLIELPLALIPIGVGCVFVARASFIYLECKDI